MKRLLFFLLALLLVSGCSSGPIKFPTATGAVQPTVTPTKTSGGQPATPDLSTPRPPTRTPAAPVNADPLAEQTRAELEQVIVPSADLRELASRLAGKGSIPETLPPPDHFPQVGDTQEFWASDTDTSENFRITATLQLVSEHAYFWIENGVDYNEADLQALADGFDNQIYPTDREFFGSEWNPGIDGDPRVYIIYAQGLGYNLAGYFSSADSVHPLAHEYSNGHEAFFISADNVTLDEEFTYGVLAHEFQHMIHWYRDRNEETWLNEGFSELAMLLNNYDTGGAEYAFTLEPDMQLTNWLGGEADNTANYGASFLFTSYFLGRFGEEVTKALVADPQNGFASIDSVLAAQNIRDPLSGEIITGDDVFTDWTITNFLMDETVADGRYSYPVYPNAPQVYPSDYMDCPLADWQEAQVYQYGADYIYLSCIGNYTFEFSGSSTVGVLPVEPYSGQYAFWSNRGDESDMRLTHSFDLSGINGPITLTYRIWYDLEEDYDYAYFLVSEDGQSWQIVDTPSCTSEDPSGNSYGCGWNAQSNGWVEESVDLSPWAGKQVQLRFEYITDAAVNGEGLLLDNISIPELNYSTDFEQDDGGWLAEGFVRLRNKLPQTYRISLILKAENGTTVEKYRVEAGQTLSIPFSIQGNTEAVLVISGTARFTNQPADYRYKISQ
jgi:immune inhibitor A